MAGVERSVLYYTTGRVTLEIHFPENRVVCQWCRFCRNEDSLKRWKCLLTDEYLVYPFQGRGHECPVEFPGGEESE